MNRAATLSTLILTTTITLALGTSAAMAQQPPFYQPSQAIAPQIVWTPTYYYDATGALWLVYVPTSQPAAPTQSAASAQPAAPRQSAAPRQAAGPAQPASTIPAPAAATAPTNQSAIRSPRSMISPHNPEMGTGRNVRMHKPWMSGRR